MPTVGLVLNSDIHDASTISRDSALFETEPREFTGLKLERQRNVNYVPDSLQNQILSQNVVLSLFKDNSQKSLNQTRATLKTEMERMKTIPEATISTDGQCAEGVKGLNIEAQDQKSKDRRSDNLPANSQKPRTESASEISIENDSNDGILIKERRKKSNYEKKLLLKLYERQRKEERNQSDLYYQMFQTKDDEQVVMPQSLLQGLRSQLKKLSRLSRGQAERIKCLEMELKLSEDKVRKQLFTSSLTCRDYQEKISELENTIKVLRQKMMEKEEIYSDSVAKRCSKLELELFNEGQRVESLNQALKEAEINQNNLKNSHKASIMKLAKKLQAMQVLVNRKNADEQQLRNLCNALLEKNAKYADRISSMISRFR